MSDCPFANRRGECCDLRECCDGMRYCDYPTVDTDCLALTGLAKAGGGEARGTPSGAGGVPDCPLQPRIGLATDVVMRCGY
jgi:hypothetical protein